MYMLHIPNNMLHIKETGEFYFIVQMLPSSERGER